MSSRNNRPSAVALGCEGTVLTETERAFFREANPFGLILFARNVGAPDELARLIREFRECVGRPDAPVFVDQEGGRVARLRPPHWPALPAQGLIGALWEKDPERARAAARLLGQAIAATVAPVGFDVACMPVADVRAPGANEAVVGDRSFSADSAIVAELAAIAEKSARETGMATTPKHAPGHGRAVVDSHHALPYVNASIPELLDDLRPFQALTEAPFWMTAHIVFEEIDPGLPATMSTRCLEWLRAETGYRGLIVSDDLAMNALAGAVEARAATARAAGCDLLLYCPGDAAGSAAAVAGAGPADDRLIEAWDRWTQARPKTPQLDAFHIAAELWALVEGGAPRPAASV